LIDYVFDYSFALLAICVNWKLIFLDNLRTVLLFFFKMLSFNSSPATLKEEITTSFLELSISDYKENPILEPGN
jgi:hypothetical protein